MRVAAPVLLLAIVLVTPASGDEEPCFFGTAAAIVGTERGTDGAILLHWTVVADREWYEVMRCDASGGPCTLLALESTESLSFSDTEAEASSHFWYRIIARTGHPNDLCASNEYCSLPLGVCAGTGRCSLHSELCDPQGEDWVCGCNGRSYVNGCFASVAGANLRWFGVCEP